MAAVSRVLPPLPGYAGPAAYAALPRYAAGLHRLAGLDGPPYNPVRIATAIGVSVRAVPTYEGTRGLLVPLRDGSYRIIVRAGETPGAQRFTVAHELVELGLQVGCPALVERSFHDAGAGRAKEQFCEAGAAELLMPLDRVRREIQARGESIAALLDLAALFGASLHAMLRRIVESSPRPCAGLILYEAVTECRPQWPRAQASMGLQSTQDPPSLRVRAAWGGDRLAAAPCGSAVPADSVLARCHREQTSLCAVEYLALGRLRGRFRVEAACPGRGLTRHVYALLHPC